MAETKVVQTEVGQHLYEFVLKTAKAKGLTLKEAVRRAIWEWASREGDLSWDPMFDPSWAFRSGKRTDASKMNEVLYGRRKR